MEPLRFIAEDGGRADRLPFSVDELVRGYRAMVRARVFDERAMTLQRQGRLGVYPPYRGQEAAQVGAALALAADDWLVPSYRDTGAALTHGLPMSQAILYWRATPAGWRYPDDLRILPFYIPIATQLLHAVGVASAGRYQDADWVALTTIGDGGTSEGDFHEALNFAAVFSAPLVLLVENNGWAISVPTAKQMRNPRIADRAAGYGIPGVVVDGNDVTAVWHAAREAVQRARDGEGPTLIEAVTYRMGPHTSSDDPKRYRSAESTAAWEARDPVARLRTALTAMEAWDDERERAMAEELNEEWRTAVREADEAPEPEPQELVEEVFESMTPDARVAWEVLRHG